MRGLNGLDWTALILVIIGGINWLLVGLFNWNLVGAIFGGDISGFSRVIYTIVGLAALYLIFVVGSFRKEE